MTEAGKMSEELLAIRDGVRLRAHLFSMEAKQGWQNWELEIMADVHVHHVPVVDVHRRVVGLISTTDVARWVQRTRHDRELTDTVVGAFGDISEPSCQPRSRDLRGWRLRQERPQKNGWLLSRGAERSAHVLEPNGRGNAPSIAGAHSRFSSTSSFSGV